MSVTVWIGTRKGAFVARSKDRKTESVTVGRLVQDNLLADYEATRSPRLVFTASRYSDSLSGSRAPFSMWRCTAF